MWELKDAKDIFVWLWNGNKDFRKQAYEAFGVYVGRDYQWKQDDLDKLDRQDRPHLSLNIVQHKINILYGFEQMNRTGWRAIGIGEEDDLISMIVTGLLKYENRNDRFNNVASRVFKDGIICGRGWIDLNVKRANDFLMENELRRESVFNVYKDPDGYELDQSDWHYMGRSKWFTIGQLKKKFPDKMKGIKSLEDLKYGFPMDMEEKYTEGTDRSENAGDYSTEDNIVDIMFFDEELKRVKVCELWCKEEEDVYYILNNKDNSSIKVGKQVDLARARVDKFNDLGNDLKYRLVSKPEPVIYHDLFAGEVHFINHEQNLFKHGRFPLQSYVAYLEPVKNKVENYGVVYNLIDPQNEKNKFHSMAVDLISRSPKGGGIYKDRKGNAEIVKNISETASWQASSHPEDFVPLQIDFSRPLVGIIGMEERSDTMAEDISGINRSMMGFQQGSKESGVLARQRVKMGTMGIQELFEHHDSMKNIVLKMMIENIRQYWTLEKIVRTIGSIPGVEPEEQIMATNEFLKEDGILKYDIEIDEGDNSPSVRAANFASMTEAIQYGVPIPPVEYVKASPWPNKKQMIEAMQKAQQEQALMALAQQQEE